MAHLLEKTRKITSILKRSEEQLQEELPYNAITRQLADIIDCNACIVNSKGRLLGYFMRYKTNTDRVEQFFQTKIFPDDYIQGANMIYDTEANLTVDHDFKYFSCGKSCRLSRWFDDYCTDSCIRDSPWLFDYLAQ